MPLETQILTLDRMLRGIKDAWTSKESNELLSMMDEARTKAFSKYMADKIAGRFWQERFPATLTILTQELSSTTGEIAALIMASDHFLEAEGEDVRGTALFGWLLSLNNLPKHIQEIAAYEYLLSCGLPRFAMELPRDPELEEQLLPGLQILQSPTHPPKSHFALALPIAFQNFDFPVGELREQLLSNIEIQAESDPAAIMIAISQDGLLEFDPSYPQADILQLCAHTQSREALHALFPIDDLDDILEQLVELGLLRITG